MNNVQAAITDFEQADNVIPFSPHRALPKESPEESKLRAAIMREFTHGTLPVRLVIAAQSTEVAVRALNGGDDHDTALAKGMAFARRHTAHLLPRGELAAVDAPFGDEVA